MKSLLPRLIAGITIMTLFACSVNVEKVLVDKEGMWNIDRFYQATFLNDTLEDEETLTNAGTIEFRDDGTGTMKLTGEDDSEFEWSYDKEDDEVRIIDSTGIGLIFLVNESSKTEQSWSTEFEIDLFGETIKTEAEWDLSLIE